MYQILNGDCLQMLKTLPDESVNCIVTSPPYYGLRDYGVDGQIGLEETPDEKEYCAATFYTDEGKFEFIVAINGTDVDEELI